MQSLDIPSNCTTGARPLKTLTIVNADGTPVDPTAKVCGNCVHFRSARNNRYGCGIGAEPVSLLTPAKECRHNKAFLPLRSTEFYEQYTADATSGTSGATGDPETWAVDQAVAPLLKAMITRVRSALNMVGSEESATDMIVDSIDRLINLGVEDRAVVTTMAKRLYETLTPVVNSKEALRRKAAQAREIEITKGTVLVLQHDFEDSKSAEIVCEMIGAEAKSKTFKVLECSADQSKVGSEVTLTNRQLGAKRRYNAIRIVQ